MAGSNQLQLIKWNSKLKFVSYFDFKIVNLTVEIVYKNSTTDIWSTNITWDFSNCFVLSFLKTSYLNYRVNLIKFKLFHLIHKTNVSKFLSESHSTLTVLVIQILTLIWNI